MRWETDGSEENRRGWLCPIIRGWLTDYAILKKNSKKKTEKIIMKKALCRAEKKNSVDARFDQLLTGYGYVKKMKR